MGHRVTQNFIQKTYYIIELIADESELGTLENPEKNISGFLLTKRNRLFYSVTEKEIILLNFFDTRSDPKSKEILKHTLPRCSFILANTTRCYTQQSSILKLD